MNRRIIGSLFLAGALIVAGCAQQSAPLAKPPASTASTEAAVTSTADESKVQLTEATVADFEKAIQSYKGKVVVIDVWFLGCTPCVQQFPTFVELHKKYGADGLQCVSLDIMPKELPSKARILKFLQDRDAAFANFIFNDDQTRVDEWTEQKGILYTPAKIVYNRRGERVPVAIDIGHEDLEMKIRDLLNEK